MNMRNNKQMLSCLICNINLFGMGKKTKMRNFKVFGHPPLVYTANQNTKHEFDITILKLYNIMSIFINFVFYYANHFNI